MSCLNPFDVQSRHIITTDGVAETLYAGCGMRGGQQYVLVKKMNKDTNKSVDNANRTKAIAFDKYNQEVCGEVAPTLKRVQGGDDYPTVFTLKVRGGARD